MIKVLLQFLFLLSSIISTYASEDCHIKTYNKIYKTFDNDFQKSKKVIKSDNCSKTQQKAFIQFILNANGSLHNSQAEKIIKSLYNEDIKISPNRIAVYSLDKILKNNFNPNSNWHWNEVKLTSRETVIVLDQDESISFTCTNCEYSGSKNVKAVISNSITGRYKYDWLNGSIVIKTKALVPINNLAVNNQSLSKKLFTEEYVYLKSPENLFTNLNALHFYKLNKPLKSGKSLSFRDLIPVSLVKVGLPTKVILKSRHLSLSSIAKPMKNGHFGELIQLRHPKTNKTIMGKVIDFNKVVVEL